MDSRAELADEAADSQHEPPAPDPESAGRRSAVRLALQSLAVAVVALLVALLAWQVFTKEKGRGIADAVADGDRPAAPDFSLPRLDADGTLRLSDYRGKAVVLNFWASWCEPCKEEAPRLQAASEQYGADVVVLGIDAQDFSGDARRFMDTHGLTYPNVHDGQGSTLGRYGVTGFPETWFVDREGRLVGERIQGPVSEAQLEENIRLALGDG
jgi:cytochrome c biogenesis protein CcmG/thiol:disulfide interchange protein DsbE